jgi:hypothetical protein
MTSWTSFSDAERRSHSTKGAVQVPGGIVTIDSYRKRSRLGFWIKYIVRIFFEGGFSASGMLRDIVIKSPAGDRELYREGPYDGLSIEGALGKLVNEVRKVGVEQFLRSRQVADQRIGPISVHSGEPTFVQSVAPVAEVAWNRLVGRRSRDR